MKARLRLRVALLSCVAALATAQSAVPQTADANQNATEANSDKLRAYLEQAAQAMHQGDLPTAEHALRRAVALDPRSMAALNNLGIVLAREGKPAQAIPFYEQALKVLPNDPTTRRNLAIACFKAERYRSAWNLLQPLVAASPKDFQLLDLSGFSLFALDRYSEAAKYLERANQADPSDLETLDMLGKAYMRTKDYKAMPSVFERIMKIDPNSASAHVMMGNAYDEMMDRQNAIKEYQAAEAADPNFMGVHSGLGYLYWRQGEVDKAEKEMRAELNRHPNDPVANCILGQILFNNSVLQDALSHFELALKGNPKYVDALLGIGKTELGLNQPAKAIPALRKAIQIDPSQPEPHFVLGTALRKTGKVQEGIQQQKISLDLQNKREKTPATN